MVYRFRPFEDSTDRCIFDLLLGEPLPEGTRPPLPPEPVRLDIEQKGFKTNRRGTATLGNYQESRIRRLDMTPDEFLGRLRSVGRSATRRPSMTV